MRKNFTKSQSGFTIIEVLIVLAIAGLILLIVFLAVPGLQRNARNTSRKNDVAALLGGISEYSNNNSGTLPAAVTIPAGSGTAYFCASGTCAATDTPAKLGYYQNGTVAFSALGSVPTTGSNDAVYLVSNATCVGNTPTAGGGTRSIVAVYWVEPGLTKQCQGS